VATGDELPGLGSKKDKPRLNTAVEWTGLKLTPTEGFVLSRIDGRASFDEVCRMSGLGREETLAILRKLKKERIILGTDEPAARAEETQHSARATRGPSPDRASKTPPPTMVTNEMLRRAQEKAEGKAEPDKAGAVSVLERLDDGQAVTPGDLVEGLDLSQETKRRILRLHRRLRKLAPHELLGVAEDADSATIRRAFAAASKELHPDRYFGKDLGGFRDKLAQIFSRMSEAMQTMEKARKTKK
jgi:hypothetical protein